MTKLKKPLSVLLSILMALSVFSVTAFAGSPSGNTSSELNTEIDLTGGGSQPNPDAIKDCTYQYRNIYYANVPIIDPDHDETYSTLPDGDIVVWPEGSGIAVVDTKGYAYKFYDNTGVELPASMTNNETFSGSELGFSADVTLYRKTFTFTQAALDSSEVLYIVAAAPATDPDVENVIALIDAIGTVEYTDACKAKIDAARAAYDLLTDAQKELVINYATLTDAETAYANLKAAADAAADPVSYLVWDDAARKLVEMTGDNACKTYTEVTADTATFEDGMWYVVNGEILNDNRITVTGTAHLILTDDGKLATYNGINVANGSTLNIYGQGAGTGTVTAKGGPDKGAGIGGKRNESGGTVNIYGGTVTATGSGGGAGIGGGWASVGTDGTGGTITIYGGTVTANGSGMGGAGIGGGTSQSTGIVTIYGGTVTANGNYTSPGIGPGKIGSGGTLTVCGGSVTAVGGDRSIAIACTVKNTIPGTGWENVNGTGDETPIAINTEGQEYGFKKIQFLGVASNPDQEAADAVIALIDAIGTVEYTDACKAKIDDARNAYDALTDAQKALVNNYQTLLDAEAAYQAAAAESVQDWQSVTIDDQIYVNFLLNEANHVGMKSITISYTNQDKEVVNTVTVDLNTLEKAGDFYKVPAVVAPAQIGDTITVTIVEADDSTTTLNTSIAAYCNALIDGNFEQKYKDLALATLEYGQAANDYFAGTGFYAANDFADTTLANAAVPTVKELTYMLTLDENARGKIASASYMALTKPEFRFYTKNLTEAEAAALNSKITVTGPAGVKAKFVRSAGTGAIMLEVTGIEAATMDQAVTITIDGFGTITFCGNDFARLLARNDSTATLGAALYNYGVAAKACFTA